jgi:hypothetical protein
MSVFVFMMVFFLILKAIFLVVFVVIFFFNMRVLYFRNGLVVRASGVF